MFVVPVGDPFKLFESFFGGNMEGMGGMGGERLGDCQVWLVGGPTPDPLPLCVCHCAPPLCVLHVAGMGGGRGRPQQHGQQRRAAPSLYTSPAVTRLTRKTFKPTVGKESRGVCRVLLPLPPFSTSSSSTPPCHHEPAFHSPLPPQTRFPLPLATTNPLSLAHHGTTRVYGMLS